MSWPVKQKPLASAFLWQRESKMDKNLQNQSGSASASQEIDYKNTLLLPKTSFPMRANLAAGESERFAKWSKEAWGKVLEKSKSRGEKGAKTFALHDGPPYANGHLHIGHALNKILKDLIVKTHFFSGEGVFYTPGWDCHGLPIEQQVEVSLGDKKASTSPLEFRRLCREHASRFVDIQRQEFLAMGILGDFKKPYLTMDYAFEANIYKNLCAVAKEGLLIQRSKPVFWSWAARSALAEAEVEYEMKEDHSIYVAFKLSKAAVDALKICDFSPVSAVIWTTTPWTLPANRAICLSPDEIYVLSNGNIVAKKLHEKAVELGICNGDITKEFEAKELEGHFALNPLNGAKSRFLLASHVAMDGGTGLVHTAPGHGEDDYFVCLKHDIEVPMPVDEAGLYDESLKELLPKELCDTLIGMHVFKANELILEALGTALLHASKFTHSYPFCWRTHKPVIYRATKQWFIAMDKKMSDGKTLRQRALRALDAVEFFPKSGENRLRTMIENRPDWCISRQRAWGVPIAFFRHKESGEALLDEAVLKQTVEIFKTHGCDAWWSMDAQDFLGSSYAESEYEKTSDILDVWFDSGSTHMAVLRSGLYEAGPAPASMYLEGSDQHRGWFGSSLLLSAAVYKESPFLELLTHGFCVDEKGLKMSKSLGNVISPQEVAKSHGMEILRLWVMLSDYGTDLKISKNILTQLGEQYKKIRNTLRFLLANIDGLEKIELKDAGFLEHFILKEASSCFAGFMEHAKRYEFSKAYSLLLPFLSATLSGIYLDVCKDRLYCDAAKAPRRVAAQSAMALILKKLLVLLAPSLTYSVDEALDYAPSELFGKGDVFDLEDFDFDKECQKQGYKARDFDFAPFLALRKGFLEEVDALKKDKSIKSTLELDLFSDDERLFGIDHDDLCDFLLISRLLRKPENEPLIEFEQEGKKYVFAKSPLFKCERSWKYLATKDRGLSPRCQAVLGVKNA